MPILYPASLDTLTNPTSSDTLAGVPHATQHSDENDAIEALETKLGTGASTPATIGHFLKVTGAGATAYQAHGLTASDVGAATSGHDHAATYEPLGTVATHEADTTSVHGIDDTSVLATATDVSTAVSTHAAEADPHTGYQKESERGAASGYASLDASAMVPVAQIRSVNAGTSFPGSPTTNDQFFRTDRGLLYYYNGSAWVTVNLYRADIAPLFQTSSGANASLGGISLPYGGTYSVLTVRAEYAVYVPTTNDGSNYWTMKLQALDASVAATDLGSMNTSADAVNTVLNKSSSLGTTLTSTTKVIRLRVDKTGAPGSIQIAAAIWYRLVG